MDRETIYVDCPTHGDYIRLLHELAHAWASGYAHNLVACYGDYYELSGNDL